MPAGSATCVGQRRIFLAGLAVFTGASLLCAVSQTQEMLIGARFVQGIGGALASAVILGMIVTMFPKPAEQAKAIGVFGFVASAGGSIGLLLGGVLTEAISWHWIFIINLPIGILVAYLARRLVADREGIGLHEGADFPGAALITVSLMLGVFTILQITEWGWVDTRTLALSAVSAALLVAFIHRQATIANPLMPLRLFRSRNVAGANVLQALLVAGMFGMFFLGALYLQRVLGYSALEVGLAFLPTTIVMGTLSLGFSEKLIMRFGPRTTLIPGVCMTVLALLLFARTPVDGNYLTDLLPPFLLIGIGMGIGLPGDHDPGDVGRHAGGLRASPRAWSTPACRSAARSAWRCWRRSPPSAPDSLLDARRLPGLGADLRLPPRLPDRRRAGGDRRRDRGLRPPPGARSRRLPWPRPSASRPGPSPPTEIQLAARPRRRG